jgi:thiosulfate dehydrogenase
MSARSVHVGVFAVGALLAAACSRGGSEDRSAAAHGRALFDDPRASPNASNAFACGTCHHVEPTAASVDPGAPLGGATRRRAFWGGQRVDLLEAINDCRVFFMDAPRPWTADDEDARAMYAFLDKLPPTTPEAVPFTLVAPADLPAGDPKRGAAVYARACQRCHGELHTGEGRLATFIPEMPDAVIAEHPKLAPRSRELRLVVIGKARSGAFRGTGSMPPFSREALSDQDLAGLLALFDLY